MDVPNYKFSDEEIELLNKYRDYYPFLSEKIHVETVSCGASPVNGNRANSRMRKCVNSLNNLNFIKKRQIKTACL